MYLRVISRRLQSVRGSISFQFHGQRDLQCLNFPSIATAYPKQSRRQFGSIERIDEEPEWGVSDEPILDPKRVKVPYLREHQRQEIYTKYKNGATFKELSQEYHSNELRIKGVVYLMKNREEVMLKENVASIDEKQTEIYTKSLEAANTPEVLASAYEMPLEEIKTIIERVKKHTHRSENMKFMLEYYDEVMKEFQEMGADTKFQETPTAYQNSIESFYFPNLLGDSEIESEKKYFIKRLVEETKARLLPHPGLAFLKKHFGENASIDVDGNISGIDILDLSRQKYNIAPNTENLESRFKYALKDVSLPPSLQKTVIRTRTGQ